MATTTSRFNKDMNIAQVIGMHPGAEQVIKKYFGTGCFTCPGMKMESISFGAMMHNLNADTIIKELNDLE